MWTANKRQSAPYQHHVHVHCITSPLKCYDALCEKQTDIKKDNSLKHDHLSSFTLPHAVPNLYDILLCKLKEGIFKTMHLSPLTSIKRKSHGFGNTRGRVNDDRWAFLGELAKSLFSDNDNDHCYDLFMVHFELYRWIEKFKIASFVSHFICLKE